MDTINFTHIGMVVRDLNSKAHDIIMQLACKSKTEQHELLLDFLNRYGLFGLAEATEEQLEEYMNEMEE